MACSSDEYICSLDEETEKRAQEELGEKDRDAVVGEVRKWLEDQQYWLNCPKDTKFILSFLRNRKFDKKLSLERIVMYWKTRSANRLWFGDIDVHSDVIRDHLRKGVFQPLPKRDSEGCVIILARLGLVDDETVEEFDDQIKAAVACMDYLLRDETTQVTGVKFIWDLENVSLRQVIKFGEERIKRLTGVWLKTYPIRFRGFHYYNLGPVFDIIIRLLKQILPNKLKQRMHTHKHLPSLYKKLDMDVLPIEYLPDDYTGPHAGSLDTIVKNFCEEISQPDNREYLVNLSSWRYHCDYQKKPKNLF